MSWLAAIVARFFGSKVRSLAVEIAERAIADFVAYAETDGYESLFEFVASLESRRGMTGSEKMKAALMHAAADVEVFGEMLIKSAIEAILGQIRR